MERTLESTICMLNKDSSNNNMPELFLLGELSGESNHAWLDLKSHDSKCKIIDYPELEEQIECVATGYGWLLILSRNSSSLFFFNPSTRQRIDLPYRNTIITAAAFSAPPTSPDCTVFTIRLHHLGRVRIETLLVGQETWTHHSIVPLHISQQDPFFYSGVQVIYSKGCFFCVDSYGRLATFDLKSMTWNLVRGMEIERTWSYTGTLYLFEFNGEIFVVMKGSNLVEKTFHRLKIEGGKYAWQAEDLDYLGQDVTLFLGPYGSCAVSGSINVLGEKKKKKKKNVFVADHKPESKCLVREIDHNGGSTKMIILDAGLFGWEYAPIWIQSTEDPIWDDVVLS